MAKIKVKREGNLLWEDECQPLTNDQMNDIKSQFHPSNTANVNIVPYHIYDEDEHVVGEWRETINGVKKCKPLYEKTIINAVTVPSANNTVAYEMGSDYIIRDYDGYAKDSNGNPTYLLKFSGNNAPLNIYLNTPTTGGIHFLVGSGNADWIGRKVDITLRYTKTTDTWENV